MSVTEVNMTVAHIARGIPPHVPENLRRCYELAGKRVADAVIANPETGHVLVHGTIQGPVSAPIGHAWVIEPDGQVWEPATATTYDPAAFGFLFNAVPEATYTARESAQRMVRSRTYGPWE